MSGGAIAGIAVGGVAVAVLALLLLCLCCCRRRPSARPAADVEMLGPKVSEEKVITKHPNPRAGHGLA